MLVSFLRDILEITFGYQVCKCSSNIHVFNVACKISYQQNAITLYILKMCSCMRSYCKVVFNMFSQILIFIFIFYFQGGKLKASVLCCNPEGCNENLLNYSMQFNNKLILDIRSFIKEYYSVSNLVLVCFNHIFS